VSSKKQLCQVGTSGDGSRSSDTADVANNFSDCHHYYGGVGGSKPRPTTVRCGQEHRDLWV